MSAGGLVYYMTFRFVQSLTAGEHVYFGLFQLTDFTDEGLRWDTWKSEIVLTPGSMDDQ